MVFLVRSPGQVHPVTSAPGRVGLWSLVLGGTRMTAQRLFPFLNYRMPDHVLEGAGERLLRVLGKHRRDRAVKSYREDNQKPE
jgi:hypothetical protein